MTRKWQVRLGLLVAAAVAELALSACSGGTSCQADRTCALAAAPSGGAGGSGGGTSGAAGASASSGAGGSASGTGGSAGASGSAGTMSDTLMIVEPSLASGKTYLPYAASISASGGAGSYSWSLKSGALPLGVGLQDATSATLQIAGTPSEAGLFPFTLSVSDGTSTASIDLTLAITYRVLFLSDRNAPGVNELFLSDVGDVAASAPVRLSGSFPSGSGVQSYAWSPDGSKILYTAQQLASPGPELWVATTASPGSAVRVSKVGDSVGKIAWLTAGNIAAYSTDAGDTYLVDLSGAAPGVPAPVPLPTYPDTAPQAGLLFPSPDGKSLIVARTNAPLSTGDAVVAFSYVPWSAGSPSAVTVMTDSIQALPPAFSFDGRFMAKGNLAVFDLSQNPPTPATLYLSGAQFAWATHADMIAVSEKTDSSAAGFALTRRTFDGAWPGTTLAPQGVCGGGAIPSIGPWSPDDQNLLFRCARDLRGISGVPSAAPGSDFSLLPSGFLGNSFTSVDRFGWSPDSKWVAWSANGELATQHDLYLMRWSSPGVATRPFAATALDTFVNWWFAPNSKSLAILGTFDAETVPGLHVSSLPEAADPSAVLVSTAGSAVEASVSWLPGSRVLLYVSGASTPELSSIPVDANGLAGSPRPVSGASGSGVASYLVEPPH